MKRKRLVLKHRIREDVDYAGVTVFTALISYPGGATWAFGDSPGAAMKRLIWLARETPVNARYNSCTDTFTR